MSHVQEERPSLLNGLNRFPFQVLSIDYAASSFLCCGSTEKPLNVIIVKSEAGYNPEPSFACIAAASHVCGQATQELNYLVCRRWFENGHKQDGRLSADDTTKRTLWRNHKPREDIILSDDQWR